MDQQSFMGLDIATIIGMMDSIIIGLILTAFQYLTTLGVVGVLVLIWIMGHLIIGFITIFGGPIIIDRHFITIIMGLEVGDIDQDIIMAQVVGGIILAIIAAQVAGGIIQVTIVAQVVQAITQGTIIPQEDQATIQVIILILYTIKGQELDLLKNLI